MKILTLQSKKNVLMWSLFLGCIITFLPVLASYSIYWSQSDEYNVNIIVDETAKQTQPEKDGYIVEPPESMKPAVVGYPLRVESWESRKEMAWVLFLDFLFWTLLSFGVLSLIRSMVKKPDGQSIDKS